MRQVSLGLAIHQYHFYFLDISFLLTTAFKVVIMGKKSKEPVSCEPEGGGSKATITRPLPGTSVNL